MDASDSPARLAVVIAAHDEADRIGATVAAVLDAFPGAHVVVADDGSSDGTAAVAAGRGRAGRAAASAARARAAPPRAARRSRSRAIRELILLCDADLAASAARLQPLLDAVIAGEADLAVAVFARRVGGGLRRRGRLRALGDRQSGRARPAGADLRPAGDARGRPARRAPFAPRFGMEIGMTVDAARAGFRVGEVEVDLEHRATGRTWRGFVHRFRQLRDFVAVWASRRLRR